MFKLGDKVKIIDITCGANPKTLNEDGVITTYESDELFKVTFNRVFGISNSYWYGADKVERLVEDEVSFLERVVAGKSVEIANESPGRVKGKDHA